MLRKVSASMASALIALTVVFWGGCEKNNPVNNVDPAVALCTLTVNCLPVDGGMVARSSTKTAYNVGDTVTLMAAAAEGYVFSGWTGAVTSKDIAAKVIMDSNKTVSANFELQEIAPPVDTAAPPSAATYMLTIAVMPNNGGMVTCSPSKTVYNAGETVTVMATVSDGYTFTGWSGASTSTDVATKIVMDGDKAILANFKKQNTTPIDTISPVDTATPPPTITYTLTTAVMPTNAGTVTCLPSKAAYNPGDTVTVTAAAAAGYTFTGWSGASTSADVTAKVVMDSAKTVMANFKKSDIDVPKDTSKYVLTTTVVPANYGKVVREPDLDVYPAGTVVRLTAIAESEDYVFTTWGGDITVFWPTATTEVTMDGDVNLTANFEPFMYALTVTINPSIRGGTVSRSPDQTKFLPGTQVTLTAVARTGYTFTGWWDRSDNTVSTTAKTITITMNNNRTIFATFEEFTYKTAKIGEQVWMAENLNKSTTSGSWCYENSPDSCNKYGRLYSWETAKAACPAGWHLPTRQEWQTLVDYAGGNDIAGQKLKAKRYWKNDGNGTDNYGFSALPGGSFSKHGDFFRSNGITGFWWTATEYGNGFKYYRSIVGDENKVYEETFGSDLEGGMSVRCIQD